MMGIAFWMEFRWDSWMDSIMGSIEWDRWVLFFSGFSWDLKNLHGIYIMGLGYLGFYYWDKMRDLNDLDGIL